MKTSSTQRNALGQEIGFALPNWTPPLVPARTTMQGRFCRLDPLDPDRHAPDLYSALSRDSTGALWTYLPYGPFPTLDSYRQWLRDNATGEDPLFYVILDEISGRAVGLAGYLRIAPTSGSIEVGHLQFSPELQRTPLATEAMYLMMKRAFEMGYRRYEWKCDALNAKSRAAAERLGFLFEGIFRQATVVKGRNRDTAWYAIIGSEWPTLEMAFQRWLAPGNFDAAGGQLTRLSELRSR